MRLFIAEKPELAKAIANFIDQKAKKQNGYFECFNGDFVTWCFGHMLQLKDPQDYDAKYEKWTLEDLPIFHIPWEKKISDDKVKQVKIIESLMRKADVIVNAGDPDEEGQLLVDELIEYFNIKKPIKRVLISAYAEDVVEKAMNNIKDNSEFYSMGRSAEARSVSDQIYGYNMTRLFTLKARALGYDGIISIGRVQTPILGLVVRRDLLNKDHVKTPYYPIKAKFKFDNLEFVAKYDLKETDPAENGKILDKFLAAKITEGLNNKKAQILAAKTAIKTSPKILPFNLLELQKACSKQFKYKPEQVDAITQKLREEHHLITYNRSDCQFLYEEQHQEAPNILEAVKANTNSLFEPFISKVDKKIKSRAFNSKKITAHHAIIPTTVKKDLVLLTEEERNVYLLIARAYTAQFLPDEKYNETKIQIGVEDKTFSTAQKTIVELGWQEFYGKKIKTDLDEEENEDLDLTILNLHQVGICVEGIIIETFTNPPPLYTIESLLDDFKRVAKYVKNQDLKKLLLEKDKDKEGEQGGIGTPATRATILANLIARGLLLEKDNKIISSNIAKSLYAMLPDVIRFPDLTALWFEQQKQITTKQLNEVDFVNNFSVWITKQVNSIKNQNLKLDIEIQKCSICKSNLRKLKGKNGFFWLCTNEACAKTFNDIGGKPSLIVKSSNKKNSQGSKSKGNKFVF